MTPLHVDGVWKPNGSSKLTMHVKFFVAIFNSFFTLKPPNPRDPGSPNLEVILHPKPSSSEGEKGIPREFSTV